MSLLSADAGIFSADAKYLVAKPSGAIVMPSKVRNLGFDFGEAKALAGPEDQKAIERFQKIHDKAEACYNAYWDKHHGTSRKLVRVRYVNGRVVSVRDYGDIVDKRATDKCKLAQRDKARNKLFKKLDKSIRARIDANLGKLREDFGG